MLFTDTTGGRVLRRTHDGAVATVAEIDDHPVGLGLDEDGTIYFTAIGEPLFELAEPFVASNRIYRVVADEAELVMEVPEAEFLNGLALLAPGVFLITDSHASTIWRFDAAAAAVEPWLVDDALAPVAGLRAPGANGIEIRDGIAFVSNTSHLQLLSIAIDHDGAPGSPEVEDVGVVLDDFAFSAAGTLFGTTHLSDVIRLDVDGTRETIAGAGDGVVGSTAAAFGRRDLDRETIYIVTDGGLFAANGDPASAGPARLVQIPVGEPGP